MEIDPNAPALPCTEPHQDADFPAKVHLGMPIRLAIAAQIMAPANGPATMCLDETKEAERALRWADALIAAHNRGQS